MKISALSGATNYICVIQKVMLEILLKHQNDALFRPKLSQIASCKIQKNILQDSILVIEN